ncbi:FecR domain-containing protein [Zhengella sp. ZM62]|uniref:FecR domain-containing protein n=1 Tax=Zhengella sedimenti TaxID=3390035 RepID=UPI003975DFC9
MTVGRTRTALQVLILMLLASFFAPGIASSAPDQDTPHTAPLGTSSEVGGGVAVPSDRMLLAQQFPDGTDQGNYIFSPDGVAEPTVQLEPSPQPKSKPVLTEGNCGKPGYMSGGDSGGKFTDWGGEVLTWHYTDPDAQEPASLDMFLRNGTHIETGGDSSATISFVDMSTFVLGSRTHVFINCPLDRFQQNKWLLLAGRIWVNVKQMVTEGTLDVTMNDAAASIKGTEFIADQESGRSTIKVIEGVVEMTATATGEVREVRAGEMLSASASGFEQKRSFDVAAELAQWNAKATTAASPVHTFDRPTWNGYRLDLCVLWAQRCGQEAADAYCQANGFAAAESFAEESDIGLATPTQLIGSGEICDQVFCDGFRYITCRRDVSGTAAAPSAPVAPAPIIAPVPLPAEGGYWQFVRMDEVELSPRYPNVTWTGGAGNVTVSSTTQVQTSVPPDYLANQAISGVFNWNSPPQILVPGETLTFPVRGTVLINSHPNAYLSNSISASVRWGMSGAEYFIDRREGRDYSLLSLSVFDRDYSSELTISSGSAFLAGSREIPSGPARDPEVPIVVEIKYGNYLVNYRYFYAWNEEASR